MWAWLSERRGKAQYIIASQQQTETPNRGSPDSNPCQQQERKRKMQKAKKNDERMKDLSQCKCGG